MSEAIPVNLTFSEMRIAVEVAAQRQCQNLRNGRHHRYGLSGEEGWTPHIEGACGEMAVAKYLGIYWSGSLGDLKAKDVGEFQVRTASNHDYRLILHEADKDDGVFLLVTGVAPELMLRGWIVARDGKKPENWSDPKGGRPAFFVPQIALHPMTEFHAALRDDF